MMIDTKLIVKVTASAGTMGEVAVWTGGASQGFWPHPITNTVHTATLREKVAVWRHKWRSDDWV
jgi:hypothetical protein